MRHAWIGSRRGALGILLALALSLLAGRASAAEVHVMISGGFSAPFKALVPRFEQQTGDKVVMVSGASMGATPTAIPARLARGEAADVVILARSALDALVTEGRVTAGSEVDLVRSRIGLAVRVGESAPDISTVDGLKRTLLRARSIAYSDSASGVYVANELFKRLGIAEEVATKARMIPGEPVGLAVARGEAEIGFQQISELLPITGIKLVGPIPEAVQKITIFSAGIPTTAKSVAAARKLIEFLSSRSAMPEIRRSGLDPVAHDREVPAPPF
jgi:molybdate transport system substrate-binding protein